MSDETSKAIAADGKTEQFYGGATQQPDARQIEECRKAFETVMRRELKFDGFKLNAQYRYTNTAIAWKAYQAAYFARPATAPASVGLVEAVLPEKLRQAIRLLQDRLRKSTLRMEKPDSFGKRRHKPTCRKNWDAMRESCELMEQYLAEPPTPKIPSDARLLEAARVAVAAYNGQFGESSVEESMEDAMEALEIIIGEQA